MIPILEPLPPLYRVILLILVLYTFLFFLIYSIHPYINRRGRQINGRILLPDVFHSGVPSKTIEVLHHWTSSLLIYGFLLYFLFVNYPTVLYYLILLLSLKLVLRLFHVVTLLPDSRNGDCHYATDLFEVMRHSGSCNNLGVSGHLISAGLALYLISLYQNHRFAWLWIGIYIVLFLTTTISRNHYTIDCLTSTVILLLVITQTERIQKWIEGLTGMHLELKRKND